ncbi:MAG: response regulator [Patescibacteria group bacterium]
MKQSKSILIVEDEVFLSKILAERMRDEGFDNIEVAGNGEEALAKMVTQRPDIILLDMILPRLNGFEVLQQMKVNPKLKQVPVLVLSNLGQDDDIAKAKALGVADYIVKSNFSLQKVVQKVNTILAAKQPPAGFQLFELIIVIATVAILAAIAVILINPWQRINQAQDRQRWADVDKLMDAVIDYIATHDGKYPADLASATTVPIDPDGTAPYTYTKLDNGLVMITAEGAETEVISEVR